MTFQENGLIWANHSPIYSFVCPAAYKLLTNEIKLKLQNEAKIASSCIWQAYQPNISHLLVLENSVSFFWVEGTDITSCLAAGSSSDVKLIGKTNADEFQLCVRRYVRICVSHSVYYYPSFYHCSLYFYIFVLNSSAYVSIVFVYVSVCLLFLYQFVLNFLQQPFHNSWGVDKL